MLNCIFLAPKQFMLMHGKVVWQYAKRGQCILHMCTEGKAMSADIHYLHSESEIHQNSSQNCPSLDTLDCPNTDNAVCIAAVQRLAISRPLEANAEGHLRPPGLQVKVWLQVIDNGLGLQIPDLQQQLVSVSR